MVSMLQDANGRDPVADAQSLLQLVGPKLAPAWANAPTGLDASKPTAPPAGTPG